MIIIKDNFEWDFDKSVKNIRKHKVSFEEAESVFFDESAILFDDPDHSEEEERLLLLGMSIKANLLIISHCVRDEKRIRIISARKAVKSEIEYYQTRR